MKGLKSKSLNIVLIVLYLIITVPMAISMYSSVMACDDFSFGADTISKNVLVKAAGYSAWSWKYHSGRWLLFFLQALINPMNSHNHLGRTYGIWMIVLFILTFAVIYYCMKVLLEKILLIEGTYLKLALFLIFAVFFTTYYYVEVYNWYIGGTAYAFPLAMLFLTLVFTVRYEETEAKKFYIGIILAGLIPATNEIFDIPLGLLYLYIVFAVYNKGDIFKDKKKLLNRILPLVIFVLAGVSVAFAPGNFARQNTYEVQPTVFSATKQAVIDILVRLKDYAHHPFMLFLFVCLVILGIQTKNSRSRVLTTAALTFLTTVGALLPYLYGRGTNTTYVDVRMLYLSDFIMMVGMAIGCIHFGAFLSKLFKNEKLLKCLTASAAVVALAFLALLVPTAGYLKIVPVDIINKRDLIEESYNYWDGVLSEIEESKEEDVVITRPEEPAWSPYFLYCGLVEEDIYDLPLDSIFVDGKIMPNVYYQKKTIRYVID